MKMYKDAKQKERIIEYIYAVSGSLIYSIGFNMLIVPLGLYSGGFMGLAQLMNWIVTEGLGINIPASLNLVGILFYAMNVPLFYMAYKIMSKEFALKSLFIVTVLSVFLMFVPIPTVPIVDDYLTASIIGGIIAGVGGGFILRGRMAGGGQDIIGVCCAKKYPDFSVGKVSIMINFIVYGFCFFIYDIEMVIYSLIFATVYSLAIDKVHIQNINTSVMIFTKKDGIAEAIMSKTGRGVTDWDGEGAYTKEESKILFVMINKYEVPQIKHIVKEIDPKAFMIFTEGCSVDGNFEKRL